MEERHLLCHLYLSTMVLLCTIVTLSRSAAKSSINTKLMPTVQLISIILTVQERLHLPILHEITVDIGLEGSPECFTLSLKELDTGLTMRV